MNNSRIPPISLTMTHFTPSRIFDPSQELLDIGRRAYQRMRFGLTTSLMAGTYHLYEFDPTYIGQSSYWYDEYDNAGTQAPGYLGVPLKDAFLVDSLLYSEPAPKRRF